MSKIDHTRPILRLIDDLKRSRMEALLPKASQQLSGDQIAPAELRQKPDFESFGARTEELSRELHQAACSVLAHIEKHGDVRLVDKLMAATPAFVDNRKLARWFTAFGPVDIVNGKAKSKPGTHTLLKEAIGTPFWTLDLGE
ncbi:hypothetical protein SAMN05216338_1002124 [Bradyrhizobium sp. Rc2d]|uniref:hypothetical protein n=1 Tax=Bradyrhizobium sp. Rc2d TaxID=1855321 RepID=UPI000889B552|nr:hypothetical protein [Bradyrhizobium sp. Rc2d]SDG69938.1 hypothetical protein SAMN05216338_1002124 [Bradyrhizobium sp. Rc2d]